MIFLFLIILGGILEYLIDIKTAPKGYYDKCINNTGFHVKLLFHHIIVIFIFFGWLSNNKYVLLVYLLVPIILIIHWKKNNNRCIMTETVNNMCKLDKNEYIRDFLYLIGLKQSNYYDVIYKTFLLFSFTVVCYKLIKKNN
jgi:hypothetical protein